MRRLLNSLIFHRWNRRNRVRRARVTPTGTPMIVSFDGRVVRLRQPE